MYFTWVRVADHHEIFCISYMGKTLKVGYISSLEWLVTEFRRSQSEINFINILHRLWNCEYSVYFVREDMLLKQLLTRNEQFPLAFSLVWWVFYCLGEFWDARKKERGELKWKHDQSHPSDYSLSRLQKVEHFEGKTARLLMSCAEFKDF